MSGLKQQIEKNNAKAEKYLSQQKKTFGFKVTSNLGFWEGYLKHGKDVLGLLADCVCIPRKQLEERIHDLEHNFLPHDVCCVPCLEKGQIMELQKLLEESK